ncbi:hypothetical protein [Sphingomonas montana]|uniref:hypothetical protein n=1 Tax=Sphingomonas montana TaxID=1843236 RepID=UPI00101ADC71|nr:hypothetical protein [Sphingomonas montana]
MPTFTVRTINHVFSAEAKFENQPTADDALPLGVHGAVLIAADELVKEEAVAAVEITVEDENCLMLRRSAVSVSVAPLSVGAVEERSWNSADA